MKVYLLESASDDGENHVVRGIFSSEDRARVASELLDVPGVITAMHLNEFVIHQPGDPDEGIEPGRIRKRVVGDDGRMISIP